LASIQPEPATGDAIMIGASVLTGPVGQRTTVLPIAARAGASRGSVYRI
jgi:AcrR family transcriptional regulator